MGKNQPGRSVSAQSNSTNEFCNQCLLCSKNCEKVTISENDSDVSVQELVSSLCRLIQLPDDPFLNYFLDVDVIFCSQCTETLQEIRRQLGNLREIQKQLNQLKNVVRTALFFSTGDDNRGTPPKRGRGRPRKSSKWSVGNVRKEMKQTLKNDKSTSVDLNSLVSIDIIDSVKEIDYDDDGSRGMDMDMCETELEEFQEQSSLLNPIVVSTFSVYDEVDIQEEDVKLFPSEVDIGVSSQETMKDQPTRKRKGVKYACLDPSNSDGDAESIESDWVPSEEERKTRSGSTKNKSKRKKPKTSARVKNNLKQKPKTVPVKDPSQMLGCTFESCKSSFEIGREDLLAVHIRRVHEGLKNPYLCPHCPESFPVNHRLENHVRKIHTGERPFICEVCGKSFRLKMYLQKHSSTHTVNERNFACTNCPMKFFSYGSLRSHRQRKHVGVAYMCELCSVTFVSSMALKDHQRQTHYEELGLVPYKCETCEKIFSTAWVLRDHQKIHTGDGLLQCPTCDYRGINKAALKGHMRVHTLDRPYKCTFNDKCDASFRDPSALARHLGSHKNVRPYKCSSCPRTFRSTGQLRNHEGAIHSGLTPFECPHCGQKFPIKKYWDRHVKKHLNGKYSAPRVVPNLLASSTVDFNVPPFNIQHHNYDVGQFL